MAAAGPGHVELRVEQSYLEQLMSSPDVQPDDAPGRTAMASLRVNLADAVGFDVPLHLVPDATLPPATMRVVAGPAWAPLRRLLPLTAIAAQVDPAQVGPELTVVGEIDVPWSSRRMALLEDWDASTAPHGASPIDALTYIAELAFVDGRWLAPRLVTIQLVAGLCNRLVQATTGLAPLVRQRVDIDALTEAMRQLVSERVPLAPLAPAFQAALDAEDGDLVRQLRARLPFRLQRTVCYEMFLFRYLVGPGLHQVLERPPDEALTDLVLQSIAGKIIDPGEGQVSACLSTAPTARDPLRKLVERRYPGFDVLAHGELPAAVVPIELGDIDVPA